jgi:RNA polymerase sigma-70 factor (ECF subfamily)
MPHTSDESGNVGRLDFESLVNAYHRPLYRFALSLTHSEDEASELTQQTFYILATKGHQLYDVSKVKTWLFTTLHRQFLQARRRESRFPHYELEKVGNGLPSIAPAMMERLDATSVLQALAELDELHRAPLTLFYLDEHSYKEIAEILEIPVGTVQSRIARGKAQLHRILTQREPAIEETEKEHNG